jgi:ribosomal protein S18 acetylase RimI-like enzyme
MTREDCEALAPLTREIQGGIDPALELGRDIALGWVYTEPSTSEVLGFALGWWILDELEIVAFGTLKQARRRGVGRRLLEAVVSAARSKGARRISLEVAASNAAALALYTGAGFEVFNVRHSYYRATGEDALEMELVLLPKAAAR